VDLSARSFDMALPGVAPPLHKADDNDMIMAMTSLMSSGNTGLYATSAYQKRTVLRSENRLAVNSARG